MKTRKSSPLFLCFCVALSGPLATPVLAEDKPLPVCPNEPGRFVIKGDTVLDQKTDRIWKRCAVGQRFREGIGCAGMTELINFEVAQTKSKDGWRIPTWAELKGLASDLQNKPCFGLNPTVFPTFSSDLYYRTSSQYEQTDGAVRIVGPDADRAKTRYLRESAGALLLVRDPE